VALEELDRPALAAQPQRLGFDATRILPTRCVSVTVPERALSSVHEAERAGIDVSWSAVQAPTVSNALQNFGAAIENLGILPAAHYAVQRLRARLVPPVEFRVYSKHARHPLRIRAKTSDIDVFRQLFVHREYRCLDGVRDADLVIDCGANVGFASAYFLSRHPGATVIAVEPDEGNFRQLQRNLAPYSTQARALHTGIWSHPTGLVMSEEPHGDNREWAYTVREARNGEKPAMWATDIGTLLAESGHERISILKIDIEGAEKVVFDAPCPWLGKVDNLVIELHGAPCEASFFKAIQGEGFAVSTCDELTVCKRS
jgi:FkbM family methyltransferase